MGRGREEARRLLETRHVLFSFEGTAERVIVGKLAEAGRLLVPDELVVRDMSGNRGTTLRRAREVETAFLVGANYENGLVVARIVDVNPGNFKLGKLYREPFADVRVLDFVTRPEIERLVLAREGALRPFLRRRGRERDLNASDWCRQRLGMRDVKSEGFLVRYWDDPDELVRCMREADMLLGGHKRDQLNLTDLLR